MNLLNSIRVNMIDIESVFEYYFSPDTSNHLIADTLLNANFTPKEIKQYTNENFGELCKLAKLKWRDLIVTNSMLLQYKNITDVDGISKLTNLQILQLDNNKITDISALKNLTSLYYLSCASNNIKDISILQHLNKLKHLNISNNPVTESDIQKVKKFIPNCTIISGKTVI